MTDPPGGALADATESITDITGFVGGLVGGGEGGGVVGGGLVGGGVVGGGLVGGGVLGGGVVGGAVVGGGVVGVGVLEPPGLGFGVGAAMAIGTAVPPTVKTSTAAD